MSKKKHEEDTFIEETEAKMEDLENIKIKLEDLKENVDMLKKIKRRKKKVNKLQQEKNGILKKIAQAEKDMDKKHKWGGNFVYG